MFSLLLTFLLPYFSFLTSSFLISSAFSLLIITLTVLSLASSSCISYFPLVSFLYLFVLSIFFFFYFLLCHLPTYAFLLSFSVYLSLLVRCSLLFGFDACVFNPSSYCIFCILALFPAFWLSLFLFILVSLLLTSSLGFCVLSRVSSLLHFLYRSGLFLTATFFALLSHSLFIICFLFLLLLFSFLLFFLSTAAFFPYFFLLLLLPSLLFFFLFSLSLLCIMLGFPHDFHRFLLIYFRFSSRPSFSFRPSVLIFLCCNFLPYAFYSCFLSSSFISSSFRFATFLISTLLSYSSLFPLLCISLFFLFSCLLLMPYRSYSFLPLLSLCCLLLFASISRYNPLRFFVLPRCLYFFCFVSLILPAFFLYCSLIVSCFTLLLFLTYPLVATFSFFLLPSFLSVISYIYSFPSCSPSCLPFLIPFSFILHALWMS